MISALRRTLPILLAVATSGLHAQYLRTHGGSLSVGATGHFEKSLDSQPASGIYRVPFGTAGVSTYPVFVSNKQQFTTLSTGFISSLQFHPVPWAGIAINYGFNHYSERYTFNYSTATATQQVSVPTDAHELTAAYQFHPKHIPFQPFVNIGGGYVGFYPTQGSTQWREAGLLESGFDLPTHSTRIGFRVSGRSLFYRAPNFGNTIISTRTWRAEIQPSVSTYYRF